MPELPEVERTVLRLRPALEGRIIRSVWTGWEPMIVNLSSARFRRGLKGFKISSVNRRGKYIVLSLRQARSKVISKYLLIHLKMSGKLEVVSSCLQRHHHDRAVFELSSGRQLCFNDVRKFGRLYLLQDSAEVLSKLGPEPLAEDFRSKDFLWRLRHRSGGIKALLLNQQFIAGIGNIYADEALWRAGIHPLRKASSLSDREGQALYRSIRFVLNKAIGAGGTDFGDGVIDEGLFRPSVYGREDEPCLKCRQAVDKIWIGQRGTHYCPKCQVL